MGNLLTEGLATVLEAGEPTAVRLLLPRPMSHDTFWTFCRQNPELQIEQTAEGELILMTPVGGESSYRNSDLTSQLRVWSKKENSGRSFDSSGGFTLPNGAERSPDASWVLRERLAALNAGEKSRFLPLAPDFAIELLSPSDRLKTVQEKMVEYVANGVRLGWLIDPFSRKVHIYRPNTDTQILDNPATLSGDPELPGFMLDLAEIWTPDI